MWSLWLLFGGVAAPAAAQSDGVVRGRVVAAADGTGVPAAAVVLSAVSGGVALEATADAGGRFVFGQVRPGEYVLRASGQGFAAREQRLLIEPREVRTLTLALDLGGLAVDVTVSGDGIAIGTHSPSSTMLTGERLDATPFGQRTSLPDAIVALAPGMIRGHDDFVHIRGHEVALNPLLNGVTFWENPHALFSSGLSPDIIDSANVMTGGFPAEYGNRFGGVVDIVTKSGTSMEHDGAVTLNTGDAGRRGVTGEFGGHRGRLGYFGFGGFFESDRFLSPPDVEAIHDHGSAGHAFAQLDWTAGDAGALRLIVAGDASQFEIPKSPLDMVHRPLADARQETRQQTAILGWTRARATSLASVSAYQRWSRAHLLPAGGPLTARAALTRELLTVGAKGDVTRSTGRHTWKAGLDVVRLRPQEDLRYEYDGYRELTHLLGWSHIHIRDNVLAFAGARSGGQVSAFVQDSLRLGSRVTADLGARVDHHTLVISATHLSPRVNIAVDAGGDAVVHASYNRFFVPPPVEGVLSSSAGLTARISEIGRALPPVAPTIENQMELGVTVPVRGFQLAATGYARRTDRPVHTTVWPDSRIYSYVSFDRGEAYGLELKADAPGLVRFGVTAYANYALGRAYFFNPVAGGFVTEAAHLADEDRFLAPMDQTHTFTGGATYTHGSGAWIGATVEFGSGTPIGHGAGDHSHVEGEAEHADTGVVPLPARVPAHTTGNVSVGVDLLRSGRLPRLTLRLDVENVANNPYLIAMEGAFSPTQYSPGRLASVTVRFRF